MARTKKKIEKPVLTEEDKRKAERAAYRRMLKETGQLAVPVHKIHKSRKKYTRKKKRKDEDGELDNL
jgi:hypothetical protein